MQLHVNVKKIDSVINKIIAIDSELGLGHYDCVHFYFNVSVHKEESFSRYEINEKLQKYGFVIYNIDYYDNEKKRFYCVVERLKDKPSIYSLDNASKYTSLTHLQINEINDILKYINKSFDIHDKCVTIKTEKLTTNQVLCLIDKIKDKGYVIRDGISEFTVTY